MKNIIFGDITTVQHGIVLHGCNNKGVMGSGVAKAIRDKWPRAFTQYEDAYHSRTGLDLGQVIPATITPTLIILNGVTQDGYGKDGKKYVSYKAIAEVFSVAGRLASQHKLSLNFPLIGAGLGGGDWSVISDIIDVTMSKYPEVQINLWIKE